MKKNNIKKILSGLLLILFISMTSITSIMASTLAELEKDTAPNESSSYTPYIAVGAMNDYTLTKDTSTGLYTAKVPFTAVANPDLGPLNAFLFHVEVTPQNSTETGTVVEKITLPSNSPFEIDQVLYNNGSKDIRIAYFKLKEGIDPANGMYLNFDVTLSNISEDAIKSGRWLVVAPAVSGLPSESTGNEIGLNMLGDTKVKYANTYYNLAEGIVKRPGLYFSGTYRRTTISINGQLPPTTKNGVLTLQKKVINTAASDETYTFKVTKDGQAVQGKYRLGATLSQDIPANGEITLKHNQTAVLNELEAGGGYKVEEVTPTDECKTTWDISGTDNDGLITDEFSIDSYGKTVVFTNNYLSTLTVSKTLEGTGTNPEDVFTFDIELTDSSSQPFSTNFAYEGKDGATDGTLENGKGTVSLKGGQSIIIKNLPIGSKYSVVENEANQNDYTTTSTNENGTISKDGSTASFVNTKNKPEDKDDDKDDEKDKEDENNTGNNDNDNDNENNNEDDNDKEVKQSKTGDYTNITFYMMATVLSALTISIVLKKKIFGK